MGGRGCISYLIVICLFVVFRLSYLLLIVLSISSPFSSLSFFPLVSPFHPHAWCSSPLLPFPFPLFPDLINLSILFPFIITANSVFFHFLQSSPLPALSSPSLFFYSLCAFYSNHYFLNFSLVFFLV